MICKKCKNEMKTIEEGFEDGMTIAIRQCPKCGLKCKSWYDLDGCYSEHDSWSDE